MSYPQKNVLQRKQKTYVKAFDMTTIKNEAKAMTEHISSDCKCKFNKCEKDYSWNRNTCIFVRIVSI